MNIEVDELVEITAQRSELHKMSPDMSLREEGMNFIWWNVECIFLCFNLKDL